MPAPTTLTAARPSISRARPAQTASAARREAALRRAGSRARSPLSVRSPNTCSCLPATPRSSRRASTSRGCALAVEHEHVAFAGDADDGARHARRILRTTVPSLDGSGPGSGPAWRARKWRCPSPSRTRPPARSAPSRRPRPSPASLRRTACRCARAAGTTRGSAE